MPERVTLEQRGWLAERMSRERKPPHGKGGSVQGEADPEPRTSHAERTPRDEKLAHEHRADQRREDLESEHIEDDAWQEERGTLRRPRSRRRDRRRARDRTHPPASGSRPDPRAPSVSGRPTGRRWRGRRAHPRRRTTCSPVAGSIRFVAPRSSSPLDPSTGVERRASPGEPEQRRARPRSRAERSRMRARRSLRATSPRLYLGTGTADPFVQSAGRISKLNRTTGLSVALLAVWLTSPDSKKQSPARKMVVSSGRT